MEEFIQSTFGISSGTLTVIILVGLFVIWRIKEKADDVSSNTGGPESPESADPEQHTLASWQQEKWDKKIQERTAAESNRNNLFGLSFGGSTQIIITPQILDQLKNTDPSSFFVSKVLSKVIPKSVISGMVEKALSGELQAGMKVKFEEGEVRILRDI
ncbi:MAG: hypothetical protein U1C97_01555 [Candidatus Gracilibacteria bacterium]|nr:hypothetical protein [bacterium]MDZ4216988.1 hypothetical protein [Candidatus Gracilibacteria bacterium]